MNISTDITYKGVVSLTPVERNKIVIHNSSTSLMSKLFAQILTLGKSEYIPKRIDVGALDSSSHFVSFLKDKVSLRAGIIEKLQSGRYAVNYTALVTKEELNSSSHVGTVVLQLLDGSNNALAQTSLAEGTSIEDLVSSTSSLQVQWQLCLVDSSN